MNLEEVKKNHVSCVYRITFPDGKYYVGQTQDLGDRVCLYERLLSGKNRGRVMEALREFGIGSVVWDVLREVSMCDSEDRRLCLSILEIKYIRECGSLFPDGYNESIGGELLGIPADVLNLKFGVNADGYACKPVLVYDADGNFVSEHASIGRCAYDLGTTVDEVKRCLDKVALVRGSYMVRCKSYGYVPENIAPFEPKVSIRHKTKTEYDIVREKIYKKVEVTDGAIMYNKNGEYVGLFDNPHRARHALRLDNTYPFGRECNGMYLFHYGGGEIRKNIGRIESRFTKTVLYDDILALGDVDNIGSLISFDSEVEAEAFVGNTEKRRRKKEKDVVEHEKRRDYVRDSRPLNCFSLTGEYICTYPSIIVASEETGLFTSSIRSCAKKHNKRAGDFVFRYEGDELDLPTFSKTTIGKHVVDKKS